MNQKISISTSRDKLKSIFILILAVLVFVVSTNHLNLHVAKFIERLSNAGNVVGRLMTFNINKVPELLLTMLSSICIAFSALITGAIISVVFSFFAATNIAPNKILAIIIKSIVAIIRAVPALVWILMVVASMGFGSTGGMIGLIFPTVGYLTKSFTASIEDLGYNTIEAMRATGANWFAIVFKGLMPSLITPFISWVAIRAEGNIAESINLGMVGVAGIGSVLMRAIGKYDYSTISTVILVIFVTMVIVELSVNKLKKIIKQAK